MSGAAQLLRQRHRASTRPYNDRRTKTARADTLRACALAVLNLPGIDQDGIDNANQMLEMVGDMLTPPRAGWYPKRPAGWRP